MSVRAVVLTALTLLAFAVIALSGSPAIAREWTDGTGKFKIEAELVAVRNGKVILEKPDGSVITVPVEKLSAADQDFLRKQSTPTGNPNTEAPKAAASHPNPFGPPAAAPQPAGSPPNTAATPAPDISDPDLPHRVEAVFRTNCHRCHGEEGASEGGFNFVLDLEKLARTVVKPRNLSGSQLYARMSASDENVMPPEGETPRPSPADVALVKSWIQAGAPAPPAAKPREFISNDAIIKYILADVRQASERSRRFMRYFTLTHLYNAGVSDDELQTYRNAFTKLINSLSWNTDLEAPQAIDPAKTVLRIDMRRLNWSSETWEEIEKANPYFLALETPDALACDEFTQTQMPFVRIDWFVFAASKPPLYHEILQIPGTASELEQMLRVNVESNIEQEKAVRAAFNRSGVSQNNRLIEWHKSPYGSYWKSYDFGGSTGRQNLFQHPLGPGTSAESFLHDGGEIIFTLPNGLQAYMLVDGSGRRIDQGPTSIVSDPKRLDRTVTNGVSCMSCHYTGIIPKADEVGPAVRANPKAFKNAADISALYRDSAELNRVFDDDGRRFATALKKIGITSLSRSGEPISAMAMQFQQEIDLPTVAAEFGLSSTEFNERLNSADTAARAFAPLRIPGGTIKRDVFLAMFGEAALELRLVTHVRPLLPSGSQNPLAVINLPAPSAKSRTSDPNNLEEFMRTSSFGRIQSLAFSPSGQFLAAGNSSSALSIFDVAHQTHVQSLNNSSFLAGISACTFSPTGTHLLAAGRTGQIQICEVARDGTLKQVGQFAGHSQEVTCLSVSSDGKFAISGSRDRKLRYWEVATGKEQAVFSDFQGSIKACQIAKNGRTASATDGTILLQIDLIKRDVTKRRPLATSAATQSKSRSAKPPFPPFPPDFTSGGVAGGAVAISADGNIVALAQPNKIRLWNLTSTGEMPAIEESETARSLAFTPDGTRLLAGGSGKINVWDFHKRRKIESIATSGPSSVQGLTPSPDSKFVAAIPSSSGQNLQIFRLPTVDK